MCDKSWEALSKKEQNPETYLNNEVRSIEDNEHCSSDGSWIGHGSNL
jgi:hypothetical protein